MAEVVRLVERLREEGQTVIFVADTAKALGLLGIADPLKETSAEALRVLAEEGVRVVMLTGDNPATARAVAGAWG